MMSLRGVLSRSNLLQIGRALPTTHMHESAGSRLPRQPFAALRLRLAMTGKRAVTERNILPAVTPYRPEQQNTLIKHYTYFIDNQYFVYIMTNRCNTVLYTDVTNNLISRTYEHKEKLIKGFSRKYNIDKLVYYEAFEDITEAISREKQIKGGSRKRKIELIQRLNHEWKDLYEDICG